MLRRKSMNPREPLARIAASTTFLDGLARFLIAISVVATTSTAILSGQQLPQEWWPTVVAVLAYLYNRSPIPPNGGTPNARTP
jgi:hypothetical protein